MSSPGCAFKAWSQREVSRGAVDLGKFADKVKETFGDKVPDAVYQEAFKQASEQYRKDFRAVDDIKRQIITTVSNEARASRPTIVKVRDTAVDLMAAGRGVVTSWDLSAPLRQGGFLLAANPKAGVKALAPMIHAFRSEHAAETVLAAIHTRANAPVYHDAGLYLAEHGNTPDLTLKEEAFRSRLAEKVPGVAQSERAYTVYLNKMRADTFDSLYDHLSQNGKVDVPIEDAQAIANYINVATGRGTGNLADGLAKLANGALFSPRFTVSRFQLASGAPIVSSLRSGASGKASALIAGQYAKAAGTLLTLWTLAELGGADIEKDPRSADFGKIRYGNVQVDSLAGMGQAVRLIANLATGQKKTQTGKISDISPGEALQNFGRSKLSPLTGSIADFAARYQGNPAMHDSPRNPDGSLKAPYGKDFIGRNVEDAGGLVTDAIDAYKVHRLGAGTGKAPAGSEWQKSSAPWRALDYYLTKNNVPMTVAELANVMQQEGINPAQGLAVVAAGFVGANARGMNAQEMDRRKATPRPATLPTTNLLGGRDLLPRTLGTKSANDRR